MLSRLTHPTRREWLALAAAAPLFAKANALRENPALTLQGRTRG